MSEIVPLGSMLVEIAASTDRIERELPRRMEKAGANAEQALRRKLEPALRDLGRAFADQQTAALRDLRAGTIDKRAFQQLGRQAGKEFETGLDRAIEDLGRRGKLDPADLIQYQRIRPDLQRAGFEMGDALGQGVEQGTRDRLGTLERWIRGGFLVGIVGAVAVALRRISQMVSNTIEEAGALSRLEVSFEGLTLGRGIDPAETLRELREATRGTVEAQELMRRSNLLLNSELPLTAEGIGELAYLSRRLAESMGMDATDGFSRVSRAVLKLEPELLDELGIMVRLDSATRKWADANDRNVETLTDAERQLAFYTATLEQARRKVEELGDEQEDAGTRLQQVATFWGDLKTAVALAIVESPGIENFFRTMGVGAADAGERVDELAAKVGAFVDSWGRIATVTAGTAAAGAAAGSLFGGVGALPGAVAGGAIGLGTAGVMSNFDDAPTFDEALERRRAEAQERRREQEIRQTRDVARLYELRAENQAVLNRGIETTTEKGRERLRQLREENELIGRRIAALREGGDEGGDTPTLDPAAVKQQKAAVTALIARVREYQALEPMRALGMDTAPELPTEFPGLLNQVLQLDREILAVEQEIRQTRGQVPAGTGAVLASLREQRDAAAQAAREITDQFGALDQVKPQLAGIAASVRVMTGAMIDAGEGGVMSLSAALTGVADATRRVREAQGALTRAQLSGDRQRITEAAKAHARAEEEAAAASARALAVFEAGVRSGQVSQAELNELIARMVALLKEAGIEMESLAPPDQAERDWEAIAETIEGLARGVLSVADAMDVLNDETRRALQGVVDLASGVSRLIATGGTDLGAWAQAIGGGVGLIEGAFGGDSEADRRREEAQRALVEQLEMNREAIERNTQAIAGGVESGEITAGQTSRKALEDAFIENWAENSTINEANLQNARDVIEDPELRRHAEEISDATGIDLVAAAEETVRTGDILIFNRAWLAAQEILAQSAAEFGKIADSNVAGQMERFRREVELFDLDSATEQMAAFLAMLERIGAGEFADQLRAKIEAGDTEGARELIQRTYTDVVEGRMSAEEVEALFGGNVTPEDVIDILFTAADGLDAFNESVGKVTKTMLGVPQGFRILDLELAKFNAMRAETAESLTGGEEEPPGGPPIGPVEAIPPPDTTPRPMEPPEFGLLSAAAHDLVLLPSQMADEWREALLRVIPPIQPIQPPALAMPDMQTLVREILQAQGPSVTNDNRTIIEPGAVVIHAQPGEAGAQLGDQAWEQIKKRARQDNLTFKNTPYGPWSPPT